MAAGPTLTEGISAARALNGETINPLVAAKAVGWFKDGGLETALPASTRVFLQSASTTLDPARAMTPIPLRSKYLSDG